MVLIGPIVRDSLATLRTQAESLMQDCCQLQRRTGSTLDPDTGHATETWATYWTGPCRVRTGSIRQAGVAGDPGTDTGPELQIPIAAPVPEVGHRAVISSPLDPAMRPLTLYVSTVDQGTHKVKRRIGTDHVRRADR